VAEEEDALAAANAGEDASKVKEIETRLLSKWIIFNRRTVYICTYICMASNSVQINK
jgi:hypothetical protein